MSHDPNNKMGLFDTVATVVKWKTVVVRLSPWLEVLFDSSREYEQIERSP